MKIILLTFLVSSVMACQLSLGQVAYYDALELNKYLDKKGQFITDDSTKSGGEILKVGALYGILKVYLPDSLKSRVPLSNQTIHKFYFENNPFIKNLLFNPELIALSSVRTIEKAKNGLENIGNLDVTNLAVAIADFMIQRSKEELTVTFFDRFKEDVNKYPELRTLFPTTSSFLDSFASHEYGVMLKVLRQSFNNDFSNLGTRLRSLRNLSTADCSLIATSKHKSNCETRIQAYQNAFNNEKSIYFFAATIAVDSLNLGSNIGNIIAAIANDQQVNKFLDSNIANAAKLSNLFSESLRTTEKGKVYIDKAQLNLLINNPVALNIYLGLLYQNSKNRQIKFNTKSTGVVDFASKLKPLANNTSYLVDFISSAETINQNVLEIQIKKQDKGEFTINDYMQYANSAVALIEKSLNIGTVFGMETPEEFAKYINVSRSGINLYYNLKSKDYSSGVFNTIVVLEQTFGNDFKYKDRVLKYGSFMAAVSEAENSDEIKDAIETVALPAGSSRIKRETEFNVSLNGYIGGFYGREILYPLAINKSATSLGVFAPVGVGANWGIKPSKPNHGGKSVSAFLSLIDVGAIAALRLEDDDPNDSNDQNNQGATFPQVKLKNIIAPGLFGIFGFGKSPFSLGAGAQIGPTLREVTTTAVQGIEDNFYLRYSLFFTVDIPFFNLYTKPRVN
ncbi:hypothetical protein [Rufibacter hautae]|uniref:Uncharacterized protein n=1 Tax=Rufibacter hautae TaxID=2595005 RepID=A0A5B6TCU7_9BACT|nr:hypothetical protein [Rufibacter hautae]KAA3437711.1 hypothetical protein FOA19_10430 [Rufibacter hautae]